MGSRQECFLVCGVGVAEIYSFLTEPMGEGKPSYLDDLGLDHQLLNGNNEVRDIPPDKPSMVFLAVPADSIGVYLESFEGLADQDNYRVTAILLSLDAQTAERAAWEEAFGAKVEQEKWKNADRYDSHQILGATTDALVENFYGCAMELLTGSRDTKPAEAPKPKAVAAPKVSAAAPKVTAAAPKAAPAKPAVEAKLPSAYSELAGKAEASAPAKPKVTLKTVAAPTPPAPAAAPASAPTPPAEEKPAAPRRTRKPVPDEATVEPDQKAEAPSGSGDVIVIEIPNIRIIIPANQLKRS